MNSNTDAETEAMAESLPEDALGTDAPGAIHLENLTKQFETEDGVERVFDGIDVSIEPGSFVTMLGRSGSGKSTILKLISGVLEATEGRIRFDPPDLTVGYVFQSPRLLPWNTALQNIEYVHEKNPDYDEALGRQYLDLVGLSEHYHKYPHQLSGGQRQRVGIARALSIDPDVLLMDEPFSNLDEITAEQLRAELISIWENIDMTIFFVTHSINEAIELSDRILMLGQGEIYADMEVTLDRPRKLDSEEFLRYRERAIETFHSQQ